jgi:hypothetical protein
MSARVVLPLVLFAAACAACVERQPPAHAEEPPDAPVPQSQGYLQTPEPPGAVGDPQELSRPRPTGDREHDALELGFWGCRVMGLRLMPTMSGRALLRATLGPSGEVLDVVAERVENLPRTVVQCLVERVAHASFDPRGGAGTTLTIPVDFTRAEQPVAPTIGNAVPTQSL